MTYKSDEIHEPLSLAGSMSGEREETVWKGKREIQASHQTEKISLTFCNSAPLLGGAVCVAIMTFKPRESYHQPPQCDGGSPLTHSHADMPGQVIWCTGHFPVGRESRDRCCWIFQFFFVTNAWSFFWIQSSYAHTHTHRPGGPPIPASLLPCFQKQAVNK